jgi:AraC-like DNA-binding protein
MAAVQYLLLAILLIATRRRSERSAWLLAGILVLTALEVADTLFIWSDNTRHLILNWSPNLLFIGNLGYWLIGPLLMLYVKSVLYQGFKFRILDTAHILPLLAVSVLLIIHYFALDSAEKRSLMQDQELMWSPMMTWLLSAKYLSIIIYGSWSLNLLARYRAELREQVANLESGERWWLFWIVIGFIIGALWSLALHLLSGEIGQSLSNAAGITKNYLSYLFVNSLVFISLRYTQIFDAIKPSAQTQNDSSGIKPELIARIERHMLEQEPYLCTNISLEKLSQQVSIPERTVSKILNRHFGQNFFEFINSYRIEAAKTMLSDPSQAHRSILDVLLSSGFTSKSSFNTIFKKTTGQTPSAFRKTSKAS